MLGLGMACALMVRCDVARAGHWKLESMTTNGKTTYPSQDSFEPWDYVSVPQGGTEDWNVYQAYADYWYTHGDTASDLRTTKPGTSLTKKDNGLATVHLVWDSSRPTYGGNSEDDGSEPDDWVFVRVTASATASASSFYNSYEDGSPPLNSVSVSASNGYGTAAPTTYLDRSGEERTTIASITTTNLIQVASNGNRSVDISFPAADVTATATGGPNHGTATVMTNASYDVQLEHRGHSISSNIETSYHKVGGETPPDLPEGSFRPTTPKNGPGPWAIMHERPKTGRSMSVTSALSPDLTGMWRGYTTLYANEPGYVQPTRTWSLSPGTSLTETSGEHDLSIDIVTDGQEAAVNTGLQPMSSGAELTTFETAPMYGVNPNLGLVSTYNITWMPPYVRTGNLPGFPVTRWMAGQEASAVFTGDQGGSLNANLPTGQAPVSYLVDGLSVMSNNDWISKLIRAMDGGFNDPFSYAVNNATFTPESAWNRAKFLDQNFSDPSGWSRIPPNLANDPTGYTGCTYQYQIVTYTKESKWYCDMYDNNGYHSPNHILGNSRVVLVEAEPFFTEQPRP